MGFESSSQGSAYERQANRLRILAELTHAFAEATTDVDTLLQLVARRFAELIGDGCLIRLVASNGVTLEPVATYHPDPETQHFLRATSDSVALRVGEGLSGRVVETGEPLLMPQISIEQFRHLTKPEFLPVIERTGICSMVSVRLRARGTNLGFISLVRNGLGRPPYTQEDLSLLQDCADRAAMAIDNGRLLQETERRVLERTAELESVNRELEAFSYSVSHDLRAPLRAIDGFSRVLEEDHAPELGEDAQRVVAVIRRNTQRMGQLIDDLLRFSRLSRQHMPITLVHKRALVSSVIEELRAAEPERAIEVRVGELPNAMCNYDLMRQVWINLIGNAIKYSRGRDPAIVEIEGAVEATHVRFTVKDNGSGFDAKYTDKLFKVFQRLHANSEFEGTGVGLALVQRIVARHGGQVSAEGRLNEGATFGFTLPRGGVE